MSSGKTGKRVGLIAAVIVLMSLPSLVPPGVEAHTMVPSAVRILDPCLAANANYDETFTVLGVTDRTWAVKFWIGLVTGDTIQWAYWGFQIHDSLLPDPTGVADARGAADDWIRIGIWAFADTLTAHVGGQAFFRLTIRNNDGASQCFYLAFQTGDF